MDGAGAVLGVAPSGGMKTDSAHLFREVVVVVGDDKGLRASQSHALREAAAGKLSSRLLLRLQLSFRLLFSALLHTPQCYARAPFTLPLHALRCHPALPALAWVCSDVASLPAPAFLVRASTRRTWFVTARQPLTRCTSTLVSRVGSALPQRKPRRLHVAGFVNRHPLVDRVPAYMLISLLISPVRQSHSSMAPYRIPSISPPLARVIDLGDWI